MNFNPETETKSYVKVLRTNCLFCGTGSFKNVFGKKHFLVKCSNCKLVTTRYIPTLEELHDYYAQYPSYGSLSNLTLIRYNEILDYLEQYRKTNNLFEAGCGFGYFLEAARDRNWNVYGTELSQPALEECKRKNIVVSDNIDEIKNKVNDNFDVIISLEVIEHLLNPVSDVVQYSKILRKGGAIYITTPNFNSFSRRLLGRKWNVIIYPEHIHYFTVKTLRKLLNKNGIEKIREQTPGFSPARLLHSLRSSNNTNDNFDYNEKDREFRDAIEKTIILRIIKKIINFFLSTFKAGDTLKVFYQKK